MNIEQYHLVSYCDAFSSVVTRLQKYFVIELIFDPSGVKVVALPILCAKISSFLDTVVATILTWFYLT